VYASGNTSAIHDDSGLESMTDHIKAGIENVVHIVSPRLDASVQSYLRTYIERNRTKTEHMIGRSVIYFPMFEELLEANGLPVDLKYLAVVESALTPQAISRVGATGLWQFMKTTGREYGLHITKYIDDRCDPEMSTKAAIKYLGNLYRQFDSWELAMAAYNAGPGRVRYAIRKSGSKDYWKLQGYLPRETRAYVPGFIAASYVLNYYQDHGLEPAFPGDDLLQTATMQVFEDISFSKIGQITGVTEEIIYHLNPKYIRKFIPQSESGHVLILPATAAMAMRAYLSSDIKDFVQTNFEGIETGVEMVFVNKLVEHTYHVKAGDNLYSLARVNGCSVDDLYTWNHLSGSTIHIGQRLKIMKMEKVLVKTPVVAPIASPVRSTIHVPKLNSPMADASALAYPVYLPQQQATPQLKSSPDFSGKAKILRRRMCAREMGVTSDRCVAPLIPGANLGAE
jgi:membrane-bound lytic murein transglycosylase D